MFVSFEGIDGSGKSTITTYVHDYFKNKNVNVMITREPGGNEIAEKIRNIILDPKHGAMDDKTEALLYAASRRQHLIEKILPALDEGKLVLCDRFIDSSIAYQGYGREIGPQSVMDINLFAIENHLPDITFFLDIDLETSLNRVNQRHELDRLENSGLEFFERVYEGYQKIIRNNPRIIVIDAKRSIEEVGNEIIQIIEKRWEK